MEKGGWAVIAAIVAALLLLAVVLQVDAYL